MFPTANVFGPGVASGTVAMPISEFIWVPLLAPLLVALFFVVRGIAKTSHPLVWQASLRRRLQKRRIAALFLRPPHPAMTAAITPTVIPSGPDSPRSLRRLRRRERSRAASAFGGHTHYVTLGIGS